MKRQYIRFVLNSGGLGILVAASFIYFLARPTDGSFATFREQAENLHLGPKFDSFPCIGPTTWKRFDQMRRNYSVTGKLEGIQEYLDWRFGPNRVSLAEINLDRQRGMVEIGSEGDEYFGDEFCEEDRRISFRVLRSGEFFFATWPEKESK